MKVVLLAGGLGTRISEETSTRPKPMVDIGNMPILWHIMKLYSSHGLNDFVICCGYKGYVIKEFFANYFLHKSDVTIDLATNSIEVHQKKGEPWKVTLIDTGELTQTGGRIKKIANYVGDQFCLTYGDGLSSLNIRELINFHKNQQKLVTMTAVQPPGRFGSLDISGDRITSFLEKPKGDGAWINGGFFVVNKEAILSIADDETIWEQSPLEQLAKRGELMAFHHRGFWQPMDTLRDKNYLETLWANGNAPWKNWD